MAKIGILYYSGVGNTQYVANIIYNYLINNNEAAIFSIEHLPNNFNVNDYSKLIIGFPTIHSEPAKPIVDFINNLATPDNNIPSFIYTTCGLYSANTIKIFCKLCLKKKIIPVKTNSYRCAATDGILLAPFMDIWYHHKKGLEEIIKADTNQFINLDAFVPAIPKLKWYSLLNYPNKLLGKYLRFKIYLHESNCTKCGLCIKNCPASAYTIGKKGYPLFNSWKCINCYRCIHHCPELALSLSKKKTPKRVLVNTNRR